MILFRVFLFNWWRVKIRLSWFMSVELENLSVDINFEKLIYG